MIYISLLKIAVIAVMVVVAYLCVRYICKDIKNFFQNYKNRKLNKERLEAEMRRLRHQNIREMISIIMLLHHNDNLLAIDKNTFTNKFIAIIERISKEEISQKELAAELLQAQTVILETQLKHINRDLYKKYERFN